MKWKYYYEFCQHSHLAEEIELLNGKIHELFLREWSTRKLIFLNLCLSDLVVRVPGYRSRGPGSIPGSIRFSDR
jgi:hypothetical protein